MTELDRDAQPHPRINAASREDRALHELLGVCRGVLFDGVVTEDEVLSLDAWMQANPEAAYRWPGSVIAGRLHRILADLEVQEGEREDLKDLLEELVAGHISRVAADNAAGTLPLDEPPPELAFDDSVFVFTGKFVYGPRAICEKAVHDLGGRCEPRVTERTNYLVLGTFASRDWAHTSFGRKIEQAVEYRDERGLPLAIVSEDHWARALPS